jgi:hypothetical protein
MSKLDDVYKQAVKEWDKSRKQGWLKERLFNNRNAQIASKEAFIGGYVKALVNKGEFK